MSIDVQRSEMDMSGRVAEEVRALLARRRMSGRELARLLDVSPSWVSYRLTGTQPIDVNDLSRIARVLGVRIVDLLPLEEVTEEAGENLRKRRFQPLESHGLSAITPLRVTGTTPHPGHPVLAGAVPLPRAAQHSPTRNDVGHTASTERRTAPTGR